MGKIVVIGSSNTDMVVKSDRIPALGETVLGGDFVMTDGGKGANQAVAVACLGGDVTFIAKVGKDIFGDQSIEAYKKHGIDTQFIFRDDCSSGIALIMVDKNAENCISVASGANNKLTKNDIDVVANIIQDAEILLMQMEIPIEIIEYATEIAFKSNVKVILNPAPAQYLSDDILRKLFLITPNKSEAQILTGIDISDVESAEDAAKSLLTKGVKNVIITLGDKGSLILTKEGTCNHIASRKVEAVDTTAAGDVYNGALCVALSEGLDLKDAAYFATYASSVSVTRMGAQTSIPTREEIDNLMI